MVAILAQVQADKSLVEALVQPIENADRIFQEIQRLQQQVDELTYKLDFRGHGARSIDDIKNELSTLQSTRYQVLFFFFWDTVI